MAAGSLSARFLTRRIGVALNKSVSQLGCLTRAAFQRRPKTSGSKNPPRG